MRRCKHCGAWNKWTNTHCKCGQPMQGFSIEGKPVDATVKKSLTVASQAIRDDRLKEWGKKQRKIQGKIKPVTEDKLFTSTLKREDDKK